MARQRSLSFDAPAKKKAPRLKPGASFPPWPSDILHILNDENLQPEGPRPRRGKPISGRVDRTEKRAIVKLYYRYTEEDEAERDAMSTVKAYTSHNPAYGLSAETWKEGKGVVVEVTVKPPAYAVEAYRAAKKKKATIDRPVSSLSDAEIRAERKMIEGYVKVSAKIDVPTQKRWTDLNRESSERAAKKATKKAAKKKATPKKTTTMGAFAMEKIFGSLRPGDRIRFRKRRPHAAPTTATYNVLRASESDERGPFTIFLDGGEGTHHSAYRIQWTHGTDGAGFYYSQPGTPPATVERVEKLAKKKATKKKATKKKATKKKATRSIFKEGIQAGLTAAMMLREDERLAKRTPADLRKELDEIRSLPPGHAHRGSLAARRQLQYSANRLEFELENRKATKKKATKKKATKKKATKKKATKKERPPKGWIVFASGGYEPGRALYQDLGMANIQYRDGWWHWTVYGHPTGDDDEESHWGPEISASGIEGSAAEAAKKAEATID